MVAQAGGTVSLHAFMYSQQANHYHYTIFIHDILKGKGEGIVCCISRPILFF